MSSLHDEIADIKSYFDGNMDDYEEEKLKLNLSFCTTRAACHLCFRQSTQVSISPPLRKVKALRALVRKIEVESLPQHIRLGWGRGFGAFFETILGLPGR